MRTADPSGLICASTESLNLGIIFYLFKGIGIVGINQDIGINEGPIAHRDLLSSR